MIEMLRLIIGVIRRYNNFFVAAKVDGGGMSLCLCVIRV